MSGTLTLARDGTFLLAFPDHNESGTWKKAAEPGTYEMSIRSEKSLLKVTDRTATWARSSGVRHLRATDGSKEL